MHTISSDVILATYCTSADFSQEKLLAKLTELKKHRIEIPEIILCRTRAELCSPSSSLSDQVNNYIIKPGLGNLSKEKQADGQVFYSLALN